MLRIIANLM